MTVVAAPEVLEESEVTIPRLTQIFKSAFFKATVDGDGDLMVQTAGPKVWVKIEEKRKLLSFTSLYGLKESAAEKLKLDLVNKMNDQVILARFSVARPDLLLADYFLPYEEGILPFQIVSAVRLFGQIVPGAIRASDEHGVMA